MSLSSSMPVHRRSSSRSSGDLSLVMGRFRWRATDVSRAGGTGGNHGKGLCCRTSAASGTASSMAARAMWRRCRDAENPARPRSAAQAGAAPSAVRLGVLREMRRSRPMCRTSRASTRPFMPAAELATRLPLPRAYFDKGYRRYGFHGLNYEHVVDALPGKPASPCPGGCSRRISASAPHVRHPRRQERCNHHGLLDRRWTGDGNAHRLHRPRRAGGADARRAPLARRARGPALPEERASGPLRHFAGHARIAGQPRAGGGEAVDYYCYSAARHAASLSGVGRPRCHRVHRRRRRERRTGAQAILAHLWFHVPPEMASMWRPTRNSPLRDMTRSLGTVTSPAAGMPCPRCRRRWHRAKGRRRAGKALQDRADGAAAQITG